MEFLIGAGVRLPERHDHAKPEGRPRAAGHDLVVPDSKWYGGDVMMPADLYPVHDGTDVTATVTHLNAVGRALDGEMVPRHVEGRHIRDLEVVDFDRLGFPSDGEAPNAKRQIGETEGPGRKKECRRRGAEAAGPLAPTSRAEPPGADGARRE